MRKPHTAPDWALMIDQIVGGGLTLRQIGEAIGMSAGLTPNMLRHYRAGVQPLYWRGEAMIVLWMQATGLNRTDVPTQEVSAPYRVPQGARVPDVVVNLPDWPPRSVAKRPEPQPAVKTFGKRKQRGTAVV